MKKHVTFVLAALSWLAVAGLAHASTSKEFDEIMKPYEDIRLTLLADSVEGVAERAEAIREIAEGVAKSRSTSEPIRPLAERIAGFAKDLTAVGELEAARTAFYEISKMMVQYRAKIQGEDLPVVMYCPMAKRSWLQLDGGEVGNPYHGQAMPNCGGAVASQ